MIFRSGVLPSQFGDLRLELVRRGLALLDFRRRPAGADGQPHLGLRHVPIGGPQFLGVGLCVFTPAGVGGQNPHLGQHRRAKRAADSAALPAWSVFSR